MKLALGQVLKRYRARKRLTQGVLALRLGSSQSRVAKVKSGFRGVTLDLSFVRCSQRGQRRTTSLAKSVRGSAGLRSVGQV
jgi:hypothetical protein